MNQLHKPVGILTTVVVFVLCAGFVPPHAFAGANQRTSQGLPIHWKPNISIPFAVNPGGVPDFSGELQRLVVIGAVEEAFRPWTQIPDAAVTFNSQGSSQIALACPDGVNLVTFQDNQTISFPPGVLAFAKVIYAPSAGNINAPSSSSCPQAHQYTADFAGQILEVDITFNPNAGSPFSPVGSDNSIDMVAVATHEAGHLLGLDHTGVFSSIMNPYSESGTGIASRAVRTDDSDTIAALYPAATFAAARGSITGTVTDSNGAPIQSANVVAFSASGGGGMPVGSHGGVPVGSQLTDGEGRYSINGLPPGNYHVFAEPLDGPIYLELPQGGSNFGDFYSGGSTNFATTFLPASGTLTTLSVAAGGSATADITVSPRAAGTLNIAALGTLTQVAGGTAALYGSLPLFLPRGNSYTIFVTGQNLTSDSALTALGNGITNGPTSGGDFPEPNRQQTLIISPSAALGPSNLQLANSGSTSVIPGGIITTVNPAMATPLRNSGGFGQNLAPGTLVSIFGTDLANGTEGWLGPPAPTRLGGVRVKVGDRYAPIFFASPGQINALIPYETPTGASVPITIVTGPNAAGSTVTVNLAPTAPGIFTVGGDRDDRGAILNGADNTVAVPAGVFPGSHPAAPGSVVVIYASGLGPVTPSLPSGIGSGANGTTIPVMNDNPIVTIGGQPSSIQFAGLAPGFVGLYQLKVVVPSITVAGSAVPVTITTAQGQTSNIATIAVGD